MYIVSAMFLNAYPVFITEKATSDGKDYDVVSKLDQCTTFVKKEEADAIQSALEGHFATHPELKFSDVKVQRVKIEIMKNVFVDKKEDE